MGQAKIRKQKEIAEFRKLAEKWLTEPSDYEIQAVAEINQLPFVRVHRASKSDLDYMRMKPNKCHENAFFMEKNDPDKKIKRVSGYFLKNESYVLHSIIENNGQYICVTPSAYIDEEFDFIIDKKIKFVEEDGVGIPYRDENRIINGYRKNPQEIIRKVNIVLSRLDNGVSLEEAQREPI